MKSILILKNDRFPEIEGEFVKKNNKVCMLNLKVNSTGYTSGELLSELDRMIKFAENDLCNK